MREKFAQFAMLSSALVAAGCTATMTSAAKAPPGSCSVAPGSKLSAELNGMLCDEVKRAVAGAIPGTPFSVEVTAMSTSRLAADMKVNGKALPQQNFAVMDSQIDRNSIRRFAQSLGEIAKAAKR
jgi:hypothetical protein